MTRRLDKALEVLDVGLQHAGDVAYGTDRAPERCARCQRHDPANGDLCTGCRAFLLGDSDDDPGSADAFTRWQQMYTPLPYLRLADLTIEITPAAHPPAEEP